MTITSQRRRDAGLTLVELIVVLAIVGMLMGLGGYALSGIGSNLRSDAGHVSAAIRYTYSTAAINNTEYRIVFSFEDGSYYSEVVRTGVERTQTSTINDNIDDFLTEEARRLAADVAAERDLFDDDEDNPFGVRRKVDYDRVEDGILKQTRLSGDVRFVRIVKASSDEVYEDGEVSMTFYPNGFQEQVMIVLEDEQGATITLVTEPLTGRVLTFTHEDDVPEDFAEVEYDD